MVRGLDRFVAHFAGLEDQYVLIGGTAYVILMENAGLEARVSKDLDIVLCLEALDSTFVAKFWEFVELGGYEKREQSDGKRNFFRFQRPSDPTFPFMIELFSRKPDVLNIPSEQHLTPIPTTEELDSLSAILLDDDYYQFLHDRKTVVDGVPIVDTYGLIGLKAFAWLQLTAEKAGGGSVDSKNINKHRADIIRLYALTQSRLLRKMESSCMRN